MDLTYDDVIGILKIIDQSLCEELRLEVGDFKLIVRKKGGGTAADPPSVSVSIEGVPTAIPPAGRTQRNRLLDAQESGGAERADPAPGVRQTGFVLKAPMVGIFYRAPAPGAPPFVDAGSLGGRR